MSRQGYVLAPMSLSVQELGATVLSIERVMVMGEMDAAI
jgi:hypothetical protein